MKKKILIGICIVVAIIVGIVIYTLTNIDSIVKSVIENAGTKATGTQVTVTGVKISISEGKATIKGLEIANPGGFTDNSMISFGEITAQVDYKTGAIKNIHIGSPHFLFEQKGTETNFGVIKQNLSDKSNEKITEENNKKPTGKSESKEAKTYQVDAFSINNAQVTATSSDTGKTAKLKIAKIKFDSLKGTPEEICQQIVVQLTTQIIQSAAQNILQQEIQKNVKGQAGKIINEQLINFLGK